jgi:hypothetical protein
MTPSSGLRTAKAVALCAMVASAVPASAVTLLSEDFSAGNPVASTAYTLIAAGSYSLPGQYRVLSNPSTDFTNGYDSYFDHTVGTGGGQMLFFDGAASPVAIWSGSAVLTAGVSYTFSYWGSSGNMISMPVLALSINGMDVGINLATSDAVWLNASYTFTPSTSGLASFSIRDTVLEGYGNDGAIDDITLTAAVPEPAMAALWLAGLAVVWRRRSAERQPA